MTVISKKWIGFPRIRKGGGWLAFRRAAMRTMVQGPVHFYAPFPKRTGPNFFEPKRKKLFRRVWRRIFKITKNGRRWFGWTFYFAIYHNLLYYFRGMDDFLAFCVSGGVAMTRTRWIDWGSNRLPVLRRLRVLPRFLWKMFKRCLPGFIFLFTIETIMSLSSIWHPFHAYENQRDIPADPFDELWVPGAAPKKWKKLFPPEDPTPRPDPDDPRSKKHKPRGPQGIAKTLPVSDDGSDTLD